MKYLPILLLLVGCASVPKEREYSFDDLNWYVLVHKSGNSFFTKADLEKEFIPISKNWICTLSAPQQEFGGYKRELTCTSQLTSPITISIDASCDHNIGKTLESTSLNLWGLDSTIEHRVTLWCDYGTLRI